MESVGFKEWALVCAALGEGWQSVIIRKGGLAERRDGFAFQHREFFLFPTFFTNNWSTSVSLRRSCPSPGLTRLRFAYFARVEEARIMTRWADVQALEPLHILRESVVRERFDYDDAPGVHIAFVRVFRLEPVWRFPNAKSYGGCRSWVQLPEPPAGLRLHPVAEK